VFRVAYVKRGDSCHAVERRGKGSLRPGSREEEHGSSSETVGIWVVKGYTVEGLLSERIRGGNGFIHTSGTLEAKSEKKSWSVFGFLGKRRKSKGKYQE